MNGFFRRPPVWALGWVAVALALGACSDRADRSGVRSTVIQAPAEAMGKMMAESPAAMAAAMDQGGGAVVAQRHIAVRHALEVVLPAAQIADAWKAVVETCAQLDCEVVSSSVRKELPDQPGGAELDMRVNPRDAPQLLGKLEGAGRVASHNTSSEDKTAQVVDVEAHIKNRTEFRDSLRALLLQAGANRKLSDVLAVQQTLSQTQAELDSQATQLKLLMQQTTRQNVQISFRPEVSLVQGRAANPIWSAVRDAGRVMSDSVAELITLLAVLLPWLVVVLPVGWIARRLWVRRVRSRRPSAG